MNTQVARAGQLRARFHEEIAHGIEVPVRRIVWNQALFVFANLVFVRSQCRGLTVANSFVLCEVPGELYSAQVSKLIVSEEVVLHLIAVVVRIRMRGGPLLVLRLPLDTRLAVYCELRLKMQR